MLNQVVSIAAVLSSVSAHSHPKNDDPARIISAAESIDRRLRQGHGLRRRAQSLEEKRDLSEKERKISPLSKLVAPATKIIGGIPSSPNRYPYLASLSYFGTHLCGGSVRFLWCT